VAGHRLAARGADLVGHRLGYRAVGVVDDHPGAAAGQLERVTAADPPARPGDQRDFSVETQLLLTHFRPS